MNRPQIPSNVRKLSAPTLISASSAPRFLWGDEKAGLVSDWIYGSSEKIHLMAFALSKNQRFENSDDFRTCYNAHETYYCIRGEFTFHNPQTGDVHVLRPGDALYIPPVTWHYGYNFGSEECLILEALTPPNRAAVEDFSQAQIPPAHPKMVVDHAVGKLIGRSSLPSSKTVKITPDDHVHEIVGQQNQIRVDLIASTEMLTTGVIELGCAQRSDPIKHPGDKVIYVLNGLINLRLWESEEWWDLGSGDTCFLPAGTSHSFFNNGDQRAKLIFSVAPRYR